MLAVLPQNQRGKSYEKPKEQLPHLTKSVAGTQSIFRKNRKASCKLVN